MDCGSVERSQQRSAIPAGSSPRLWLPRWRWDGVTRGGESFCHRWWVWQIGGEELGTPALKNNPCFLPLSGMHNNIIQHTHTLRSWCFTCLIDLTDKSRGSRGKSQEGAVVGVNFSRRSKVSRHSSCWQTSENTDEQTQTWELMLHYKCYTLNIVRVCCLSWSPLSPYKPPNPHWEQT